MRIAITGATGRVGRQLIPRLIAAGVEPVLLGRNPVSLASNFPDMEAYPLSALSVLKDVVAVVHMAAVNNDSDATSDEFRKGNVDLTLQLLEAARLAGIPRFIFLSSIHALSSSPATFYAETKRQAAQQILQRGYSGSTVLHCAAVVGDRLSGRLGVIERFPAWVKRAIFPVIRSLKATLSIDRLSAEIVALSAAPPRAPQELILTEGQTNNRAYHFIKRLLDIIGSLTLILLAGWAVVASWIAIRLTSSGPGFFLQERVGKHGRTFRCVKLRTMSVGTPSGASHQVGSSTITPLGHKLRKTKLDEVPQVWNVLKGEMSFVGPRPCLPSQHELIEARRRHGVLEILPGITGRAQIAGIDMSGPERLAKVDREYRDLQSVSEDLKIILATVHGKGSGDAANKGSS